MITFIKKNLCLLKRNHQKIIQCHIFKFLPPNSNTTLIFPTGRDCVTYICMYHGSKPTYYPG